MSTKFMKSNISKNEFYFGLVKVMTKFEKKNGYHYTVEISYLRRIRIEPELEQNSK